ncbi:MAG: flavodoxin-dependent (E)-4-hydroxy-3-methylbut-2-enyl-diphosphate synthase [Candidatus Ancaeobacter aquaticus]|nr:flavodoxin-dependent (E)-4-hydroxy-3-methylbut-2-enyl-diphosphate synthase [Candidatus Ancaeobacter aquaticus]
MKRRKTKKIMVGKVPIGGSAPISIQSMTTTDTKDVRKTVAQIKLLERQGCEIVRVTVKDKESARALEAIQKGITIPLVADIHFDWRLAIEAAKYADCVRLNPGNIYKREQVVSVIKTCKARGIPIRIGANSGSVKKNSKRIAGLSKGASDLVNSVLSYLKIFEKERFKNIKISLKASNVRDIVMAYRVLAKKCDYPFHVGVTASGLPFAGTIKSSIGIGALLVDGIGDTVRVSLTSDPINEVKVAKEILKCLNLREFGPTLIACPTCGRSEVNLIELAKKIDKVMASYTRPIEVAVMGCVVNGPGEAREADIGIAGGKGVGVIFRKGKVVKKVKEKDLVPEFIKELERLK